MEEILNKKTQMQLVNTNLRRYTFESPKIKNGLKVVVRVKY